MLAKLNRYKIFLQVTTILEVTTGNNKDLAEATLDRHHDHNTPPHYYTWPIQAKSMLAELNTWIFAWTECFANNSK